MTGYFVLPSIDICSAAGGTLRKIDCSSAKVSTSSHCSASSPEKDELPHALHSDASIFNTLHCRQQVFLCFHDVFYFITDPHQQDQNLDISLWYLIWWKNVPSNVLLLNCEHFEPDALKHIFNEPWLERSFRICTSVSFSRSLLLLSDRHGEPPQAIKPCMFRRQASLVENKTSEQKRV